MEEKSSGSGGDKDSNGLKIKNTKDIERPKESQLNDKENLMEVEVEEVKQEMGRGRLADKEQNLGRSEILAVLDQNRMKNAAVEKGKGVGVKGGM